MQAEKENDPKNKEGTSEGKLKEAAGYTLKRKWRKRPWRGENKMSYGAGRERGQVGKLSEWQSKQ